jgi:hypothetical protein
MASIYAPAVKEKLRNIADLTNRITLKFDERGKNLLYEEIISIWKYINEIYNFESKFIKDLIEKMHVAFDAYIAGAITKEQLIIYMVKNEAVSSLLNNLDSIS